MESYQIAVELALTGNAVGEADKLAGSFRRLDDILQRVQRDVQELQTGMAGLDRIGTQAADSWIRAASAMERAASAATRAGAAAGAGGPGRALVPYLPSSPDNGPGGRAGGPGGGPDILALHPPGPRLSGPLAWAGAGGGGGGEGGGPPERDAPFEDRPEINLGGRRRRGAGGVGGAFELAIPAAGGADLLKNVFGAAMSKDAIEAGLIAQGFSPAQVKQLEKSARETQRTGAIGSSITGNLAIGSKLMAVLQDPNAAIAAMPAFARLGVALDSFGEGEEGAQLMDAIRAGDFRGAITHLDKNGKQVIDPAALQRFINEVTAETIATHGQVGPAQILGMVRAAGITGTTMSSEELFGEMMSLNLALGSSRAGTGLQAFGQQFGSGKMNQAAYHILQQMGVVSDKPGTALKAGMGNYILLPSAIDPKIRAEAYKQPLKFLYDYLLPKIQAWNAKKYGKSYTNGTPQERMLDDISTLQTISSRIPAANFAVLAVKQRALVERDLKAYEAALGRDAYSIQAQQNPELRVKALGAAWQAVEISFGDAAMKPAIGALNDLTDVLNRIGDWAKAHPEGAKYALEGLAVGVAGLGTAASAMFAAGILGRLSEGLGGLAVKMGASETAVDLLGASVGRLVGTGGVVTLALALGQLAKATGEFPAWLIHMAEGAAIGGRVAGPLGAVAGAGAGAVWDANPLGLNDTTPGQALDRLKAWWQGQSPTHRPAVLPPPGNSGGSVPVHVTGGGVAITNPGDIKHGVTSGIVHDAHGPQTGPTGSDIRVDPWAGAFQAAVP